MAFHSGHMSDTLSLTEHAVYGIAIDAHYFDVVHQISAFGSAKARSAPLCCLSKVSIPRNSSRYAQASRQIDTYRSQHRGQAKVFSSAYCRATSAILCSLDKSSAVSQPRRIS